MEIRLDHPEVLSDFESAPLRRVRRWVGVGLGLWLSLLAADWSARFLVFRWHRQWMPTVPATPSGGAGADAAAARTFAVPAQTGGGLTAMLGMPWLAKRYEEFHPGYSVPMDPFGYRNPPLPEGRPSDVVMLGDSFLLSLGTQNVAQALASIGGRPVYNHARAGAGPFQEMWKFIASDRFDPPPPVVVWNLSARELGAPLFSRQPVDYWFARARSDRESDAGPAPTRIRRDLLDPRVLRQSWPDTSLAAYGSRRAWMWIRFLVFREWPKEVRGVEDPVWGPMLFYGENLRLLPLYRPEVDAPAVVQTAVKVAHGFRERGMSLVVLLVPEKEQIHARALPPEDRQTLARGPELLSAIERGLLDAGVPTVNLIPAFQEATARGERLYWRDDTHWNDAGIRLAAEELWRVVEPLLP